jgi:hypothetical protein
VSTVSTVAQNEGETAIKIKLRDKQIASVFFMRVKIFQKVIFNSQYPIFNIEVNFYIGHSTLEIQYYGRGCSE